MNKKELLKLAKQHHIVGASLSKIEIVRNIQLAEGNFDCYATAGAGECDQAQCRWRGDCLPESTRGSKIKLGRAVAVFRDPPQSSQPAA